MVQIALQVFSSALQDLLRLAVPIGISLAVLFGLLLAARLLAQSGGRFQAALAWTGGLGTRLGRWALVLLALGAAVLLLDIVHRAVEVRLGGQLSARYTNSADPNTSATVQLAPSATYLSERTYLRSLVIPPALLKRVGEEGVQVLAPYLQDPSAQNIVRLTDTFRRSGRDVVFTRRATLQTQEYITLDTSKIAAELNFVQTAGGGHQSYYNASFSAQYSFRNPLSGPATVRFAFPLPSGSGTLSGFQMIVNGKPAVAADLSQGSVWEGTLAAGEAVNVLVTYRHQGSRGWNYDLSQRREPIKNFDLSIRTDQPTKFERYSLFPTRIETPAFGGPQTLHWQLQNAITAQNVAVVFQQGSLRETLSKLAAFTPLSLSLGTVLLLLWAGLLRLPLGVGRLALALLGLSLGFAFGGILTGYLPPVPAELLGGALALAFGWLALGRRYAAPLLLTVLAPLTFLSVGNAGLLLGLLAALALLLVLLRRGGRADGERPLLPGS